MSRTEKEQVWIWISKTSVLSKNESIPRCSMYDIRTYICHILPLKTTTCRYKYTIHWVSGMYIYIYKYLHFTLRNVFFGFFSAFFKQDPQQLPKLTPRSKGRPWNERRGPFTAKPGGFVVPKVLTNTGRTHQGGLFAKKPGPEISQDPEQKKRINIKYHHLGIVQSSKSTKTIRIFRDVGSFKTDRASVSLGQKRWSIIEVHEVCSPCRICWSSGEISMVKI